MTVRVGFYGTGLISGLHAALLSTCQVEHEIVAVHDPDGARAGAFADAVGAMAVGEDELLDLVDAVYVTTWTSEHPRLVEKIASRGLAVFCEKPLAVDAPTVESMIRTVEAAGVINQVGFLLRSAPTFIQLRELIDDRKAGRVLAISFRDDQYIPNQGRYASTWRVDPARAGRGALLEHSIHDVDILRFLAGPVSSVSASMREVHGHAKIDDVAAVRLEFDNGAMANLTSVWHDILERPSMRHVEIFCERLYASLDNEIAGPVRWQYTGEDPQTLGGEALVAACRQRPAFAAQPTMDFLGGSMFNTAAGFLAAVSDGRPASPCFSDALVAHRVVDAIYASADGGGVVIAAPEGAARA